MILEISSQSSLETFIHPKYPSSSPSASPSGNLFSITIQAANPSSSQCLPDLTNSILVDSEFEEFEAARSIDNHNTQINTSSSVSGKFPSIDSARKFILPVLLTNMIKLTCNA